MHSSRSRAALDVFVEFLALNQVRESVREIWNPFVDYLFLYAFIFFFARIYLL
jgi:hypothetical protein